MKNYLDPKFAVLRMALEEDLLGGSVVQSFAGVMTAGQEIAGYFEVSDGDIAFDNYWED